MIQHAPTCGVLNIEKMVHEINRTINRIYYQVYAPNQNENVYTNLWTGPYYGYERAIETFELTGAPRRLKPINIYYHAYSASKRASITALDKVYRWALAQPVNNLHASEYIRKVHDFNTLVVARAGAGGLTGSPDAAAQWLVRGAGELRELRLPASLGHPVLDAASGLTGYNRANDQHYLHMARGEARVALAPAPSALPHVAEANGRTMSFERDSGMSITLATHSGAVLALANAAGCEVRADGRVLAGRADGPLTRYENRTDGPAQITARCR